MSLLRQAHKKGEDPMLFCVGSVGIDFFHRRNIKIDLEIMNLSDNPRFGEVKKIISKTVDLFQKGLYDHLLICYNHFVNSLTSTFRVLDTVLPQYAENLIYGAILDAKLAEHSASTMAMKSATDNADDLINRMSIEYNRARQGAITTEINEIVGGASALE